MQSAVLLIGLTACSFQPGVLPPGSDGGGPNVDAAIDARLAVDAADVPDAMADALRVTGSLSVTSANLNAGDTNLTVGGLVDWAHWGYGGASGFDHKLGGTSISNVTVVGGGTALAVTAVSTTATWTDGTPNTMVSATGTGVGIRAPAGLQITVPASTVPITLDVDLGGKSSTGRLDVALSDASAGPYTTNVTATTTAVHVRFTIVFNAASAGQTLSVTWTDTVDSAGTGFEMLLSAMLH